MASHLDFGVSGCGCFWEFRNFGWGCFAIVQTWQSVAVFSIGKENIDGFRKE